MEVQTAEATQSPESQVPASSTPAPEAASASPQAANPQATPEGAVDGQTPVVAPYNPNFKYKVFGKEHEVPEAFRAIVKDEATEKQVRELFEKATGIDFVKQDREAVKREYKQFREENGPILDTVAKAHKAYTAGDVGLAFKFLGIPEKAIFNWAVQQANMQDLPPDQKAVYAREQELRAQSFAQQERLEQLQAQQEQYLVQQRTQELDMALQAPEVASIAQAYEAANGPGSFKYLVASQAEMKWKAYQKDVSPQEAVAEVVKQLSWNRQAQPQAQAQIPQQQAPQVTTPQQVPVIPMAKGSQGSPAAKNFNKIEDVLAHRKQSFGF